MQPGQRGQGLDETRMTIGEHLEELRWHVLRAVLVVFALLMGALYFQEPLLEIATWPHRRVAQSVRSDRVLPADVSGRVREALDEIEREDQALVKALDGTGQKVARLRERLDPAAVEQRLGELEAAQAKLQAKAAALDEELSAALGRKSTGPETVADLSRRREALLEEQKALKAQVESEALAFLDKHANVPRMELTQLTYTEAFLSSLKLCLVVALFLGSPVVVRELWSFVAKGLYPHEKRYARLFGPLSFLAFVAGGAFGYFILIPVGLKFLISYASADMVGATIAVGDYLSLFVVMTLVMGAIFELPLVMVFTTLLGLTDAPTFRRFRRHCLLGSFVLSAFLTPTPDPFTLCLMAGPLYGLFELGIWLSAVIGKGKAAPAAEEAPPAPRIAPPPAPARPAAPVPTAAPAPTPTPAPAAAVAPTPAPAALVVPEAPPPQTVARGAAPDLNQAVIGGGGDEELLDDPPAADPYVDIGDDTFDGGESTGFDPSLEDPDFDRMGRNLVGEPAPEPTPPPAAEPAPAPASPSEPAPGRAGGGEGG